MSCRNIRHGNHYMEIELRALWRNELLIRYTVCIPHGGYKECGWLGSTKLLRNLDIIQLPRPNFLDEIQSFSKFHCPNISLFNSCSSTTPLSSPQCAQILQLMARCTYSNTIHNKPLMVVLNQL